MLKFEKELSALMNKHKVKRLLKGKPKKCPKGTKPVKIEVNGEKMWVCR